MPARSRTFRDTLHLPRKPPKRFSISVVFAPPKPKELEITTSNSYFRAPSLT